MEGGNKMVNVRSSANYSEILAQPLVQKHERCSYLRLCMAQRIYNSVSISWSPVLRSPVPGRGSVEQLTNGKQRVSGLCRSELRLGGEMRDKK
jgi:hypothetical protein